MNAAAPEGAENCVLNALARFAAQQILVTDGKTSPDYLPKKMRETKLAHDCTAGARRRTG